MPGQGKYEGITVTGKDIPPDEPLFLLRSQDKLAPGAVEDYARAVEVEAGMTTDRAMALRLEEDALDVRAFALRMRRWQIENPDRVKTPD